MENTEKNFEDVDKLIFRTDAMQHSFEYPHSIFLSRLLLPCSIQMLKSERLSECETPFKPSLAQMSPFEAGELMETKQVVGFRQYILPCHLFYFFSCGH